MPTKAQTLYLIDGHAQLYRAYHGITPGRMFAADRKTPTNAVFGFGSMLRSLRSRFKPDLLAAVFDPHGAVYREQLYNKYAEKLGKAFSGYKSQRDSMPDDLRPQIEIALELCVAYGIPALQVEGYEADDVLGTLALLANKENLDVVIVTGDKDLLQLVCGNIKVYDPMKDITFDEETVLNLKGVKPCQIIDWLGFRGDSSDNIPGVAGVGDQTAVKLLQTHGSMEAALEYYKKKFEPQAKEILAFVQAHEAEGEKDKEQRSAIKPPKGIKVVEAYLYAQAERALACRELARLTTDLPLKLDLDKLRCRPPEAAKLAPLLKRLDFRKFMDEDLKKEDVHLFETEQATAAEAARIEAGEVKVEAKYAIIDDAKKLDAFAKELKKQSAFALDVQTTSDDPQSEWVGVSISWNAHEGWYLPVRGPMGSKFLDRETVLSALKPSIENPKVEKYGHNIKFALKALRKAGLNLRGIAFDTMLAGWLLDPGAMRVSLAELAYHYFGMRTGEKSTLLGKGKEQITIDLVPIEDLSGYACNDADCVWQATNKLAPMLREAGLDPLMREIEVPLIEVLAEMELTGIKVDADLLHKMSKSLELQLAALEEDIYQLAGEHFNIGSPKQLGTILFDKLGLVSKSRTATGQSSTSEEVLLLLAKEHDLPRIVLEYRGMMKLKNTYVDALPAMISPATGRIHASFHQTGAETGRISSTDPNLQNIPIRSELGRSIRAAFKPGYDGWKILCADYSQIELRILAHYSQDPLLLEAFKKGTDIHTAIAAQLNKVAESEVTRDMRARAKAVNFGIIYGQTPFGLANTLSISKSEAANIIDTYFTNHSQVKKCINEIIARASEQGFITTVMGRRRFIPQLRASDRGTRAFGERLAVNTVFQGSAADLIKKAMIEIHNDLKQDKWKSHMLLQIHDELLFECPSDETERLKKLVIARMEGALKLNVPLVVEAGAGNDWLSAKD